MATTNLDSLKINMLTEAQFAGIATPNPDELYMTSEQGLIHRSTGATGIQAHTEGNTNIAEGDHSHVEGHSNTGKSFAGHVAGINNFDLYSNVKCLIPTGIDTPSKKLIFATTPSEILALIKVGDYGIQWQDGDILRSASILSVDSVTKEIIFSALSMTKASGNSPLDCSVVINSAANLSIGTMVHPAYGANSIEGTSNVISRGRGIFIKGNKNTYCKGTVFIVSAKDPIAKTLTLKNIGTDDFPTNPFNAGDTFCVGLGGINTFGTNTYSIAPNEYRVSAVNNNIITVDTADSIFSWSYIIKPLVSLNPPFNDGSYIEGTKNIVSGTNSHAEGNLNIVSGNTSHAEGNNNTAYGMASHVEGSGNKAVGTNSHAEGSSTRAMANSSHTEGSSTETYGDSSHAEGQSTIAFGQGSHAEGYYSYTVSNGNHAEGKNNISASGIHYRAISSDCILKTITLNNVIGLNVGDPVYPLYQSGSIVKLKTGGFTVSAINGNIITVTDITNSFNDNSILYVIKNTNDGAGSHAEGTSTMAFGDSSHAEGKNTKAFGAYSHAEGESTYATGNYSHAEGMVSTASGAFSHAEGISTTAEGPNSHAEGAYTRAAGIESHAEGTYTQANGASSHAQNLNTVAVGQAQTAIGKYNIGQGNPGSIQDGDYVFIIGNGANDMARSNALTVTWDGTLDVKKGINVNGQPFKGGAANILDGTAAGSIRTSGTKLDPMPGLNAFAEGEYTAATGIASHAEGGYSTASGVRSHAEGSEATASGYASHAEGSRTQAIGNNSHSEGNSTVASGSNSHAEGTGTKAMASSSHAEGTMTYAMTQDAHVEGKYNFAGVGNFYKITAYDNTAKTLTLDTVSDLTVNDILIIKQNDTALIEVTISAINGLVVSLATSQTITNYWTCAIKVAATVYTPVHAEGYNTIASGDSAHTEGIRTIASGGCAHAEGSDTVASGGNSHAEGQETIASGSNSHVEGYKTIASSSNSHAEGNITQATGSDSHAQGRNTIASGNMSHAEGYETRAIGEFAHAQNQYTIAKGTAQTALGKFNIADTTSLVIVGNGTSDTSRANALTVEANGSVNIASGANFKIGGVPLKADSSVYDKVIRTQAEFDALIASPTWLDAKSVCFIGNGGTLKFTRSDEQGCLIPSTVKQIQGINSAIIEATNFKYVYGNNGVLWYATRPTTDDYFIDGITVICTSTSNGTCFYNCTQLTNCTGTCTGGTGFNNCTELANCISTGTTYGFYSCTQLINCTGTGVTGGFYSCIQLTNCTGIGTSTGVGFNTCTQLTNCIGTGRISFSDCIQLTNCTGTGVASGGNNGYGFYSCTQLTNCTGTGTSTGGSIYGYGFRNCNYLSNCKAGNASTTATFDNCTFVGVTQSTSVTTSILASAWVGSEPATCHFLNSNITSTCPIELLAHPNMTKTQLEALQAANIQGGPQSAGDVTLRAWGTQPTIDLPVQFIIRGDM